MESSFDVYQQGSDGNNGEVGPLGLPGRKVSFFIKLNPQIKKKYMKQYIKNVTFLYDCSPIFIYELFLFYI